MIRLNYNGRDPRAAVDEEDSAGETAATEGAKGTRRFRFPALPGSITLQVDDGQILTIIYLHLPILFEA
jgi:hypothetical protein